MKIQVLGMDPSLRNWGLALGELDLTNGVFEKLQLKLVQPKEETSKQVRKNSKDLELAQLLVEGISPWTNQAQVIFVETPVGSQSARAMASYGVCVGILGAMRATGRHIIEVTATEVKLAIAGKKDAKKNHMITSAIRLYPEAKWPMYQGKPAGTCEHLADAVGTIHAGVKTPVFKNLMRILQENKTP